MKNTELSYIIPFSNDNILKNWFMKSPLEDEEIITLHLDQENSAPQKLNKILDDLKKKQWLVICDEGVRLLKNARQFLKDLDKKRLYGITGARIGKEDKKFQTFDGRTGFKMINNKIVDSIGQGCMIFHASLLKKHELQFDESFIERYMVDFSLKCKIKGIDVSILSIESRFKERVFSYEEEELFRKKLRQKYSKYLPIGLWGGTLTENSQEDLKTFLNQRENWIKTLIKEKAQLTLKVIEFEKLIGSFNKKNFPLSSKHNREQFELENELYDKLETKLIWIFGTPRSGSTWLAHDILKREGIRSVDETMIGAQLGAFYDNPAPHWALMLGHYNAKFNRIIDRDRDDLFFSSKFEKGWKDSLKFLVLNRIREQFGFTGFNHILIKAPNESHGSDILMKCLPNSKLIFLVRDGRDVIDSRQGKFHNPRGLKARPETSDERKFRISHFALMWNLMIETTQKAYDSHNSKLKILVRYEDLRLEPISQINRIYKFLGYDLPDEEIKRIADSTSFENIPKEMKGKDKNIRQAKPRGFEEYFTNEELKIVNNMMKNNLLKYGYKI